MKTSGIAELRARLSEYLARVKAAEEVLVTERGRPIARITPLAPPPSDAAGLWDLERAGLLQRPLRPLDESFWKRPRPKDPEGAVLAALLAERASSP